MLGLSLTAARTPADWWPSGARFAVDFVGRRAMANGAHIALGDALSFSRASAKMLINAAGDWQSFSVDVPAFARRGLNLEPSATNALANAILAGAELGDPGQLPDGWGLFAGGGLGVAIVASGIENGLPHVDIRIAGTSAAVNGVAIYLAPSTSVPATVGQTWTASMILSRVAGSLAAFNTVRLNLREYDAGGGGLDVRYGDDLRDIIGLQPQRRVTTRAIAGGAAAHVRPMLELTFDAQVDFDVILRLAAPQLEIGDVATSPILTEQGSGTRAADRLRLNLPEGTHHLRLEFDDADAMVIDGVGGAFDLDAEALTGRWLRRASVF